MAARKKLFHPEDVRRKIQASQLVNLLRDHATGVKVVADASRIKAAEILLKKAMPDLSAIEYTQQDELPAEGPTLDRIARLLANQPDLELAMLKQLVGRITSKPPASTQATAALTEPLKQAHAAWLRAVKAGLEQQQTNTEQGKAEAA